MPRDSRALTRAIRSRLQVTGPLGETYTSARAAILGTHWFEARVTVEHHRWVLRVVEPADGTVLVVRDVGDASQHGFLHASFGHRLIEVGTCPRRPAGGTRAAARTSRCAPA